MASGVTVKSEVTTEYNKIKTGKKNPYVIFRITPDCKEIEVESVGEEGETFEDFRNQMFKASKAKEGRYAVFDLKGDDHCGKNATGILVFILWISDCDCSIKQKMLYTSSKSVIKQVCVGTMKEVQINDKSDFTLPAIWEKIGK